MSVRGGLEEVKGRIARAAAACGRDPTGIRLVAVSKTKPVEAIREAYEAGQRAFGENYAQELAAKREALADLPEIEWHFIGHLQTNKAKLVAKAADVVHAVDSSVIARELGKRVRSAERPGPLPVLVEVNVTAEPQKHGVAPSELGEVMAAVQGEPGLALRGLMTMPPFGDLVAARRTFETLASLRSLHGGAASLPELSMGMSADFEIAIACGATMVRVGTAIFGAR
ncbi:MAG: YggS family pyridoxal phosphate-dependent enzyme [Polyangiaceae bacterium]